MIIDFMSIMILPKFFDKIRNLEHSTNGKNVTLKDICVPIVNL